MRVSLLELGKDVLEGFVRFVRFCGSGCRFERGFVLWIAWVRHEKLCASLVTMIRLGYRVESLFAVRGVAQSRHCNLHGRKSPSCLTLFSCLCLQQGDTCESLRLRS